MVKLKLRGMRAELCSSCCARALLPYQHCCDVLTPISPRQRRAPMCTRALGSHPEEWGWSLGPASPREKMQPQQLSATTAF